MKSMTLKIISDGTTFGTKIVDAETGRPLSCVQSVKWELDNNDDCFSKATLEIIDVPIEITTKAMIKKLSPNRRRRRK